MNVNDIKLLPHNQVTYNKIQEAWKTSNKVASIQATGTGKSYLILKCLYNIPNENKLVLAPSNYILEQLENEFGENLPNTTLMTYADLSMNTEDKINNLGKVGLIVLDEFHRCGAESWGTGIQKLLDTFPNAKILGTSATNIRFLDDNRDMAEELFDGNVVNNLSLAEAIVKKILPMPKYVNAIYSFDNEISNLKNKVNDSKNTNEEKEDLLKEIDKMKNKLDKSKGIPQILKKHLNKNSNDKFIIFCKDGQHLNEMKKIVTDWFKKAKIAKNIKIYEAYTGYNNTDKEVENFRNNNDKDTIKLLFSINMFNEGIHIKDVSGVILLRPTISPIIYYQQIGRAIQVGKENNPLIFDFVNNFDNIGAKNFISDLKEYSKQQRKNSNNNNEELNQDEFEFMIFDEMQEVKTLFEKLVEFYNKNGYSDVHSTYKDKILADWVIRQRQNYKMKRLSKNRIDKLEKLEFIWNINDTNWEQMYKKLEEYKKENGNCNISLNDKDKSLVNWVRTQRRSYKKNNLDNTKLFKLQSINFEFDPKDYKWNKMYQLLIEYKKEYNNCLVPKRFKYKNMCLGTWTRTQRIFYNQNKLSEDKIISLNKINFDWIIEKESDSIKGVNWNKVVKKWAVSITICKNTRKYLGYFTKKEDAIKARRNGEIKYFGKSDINLNDFKDEA